MKYYRLPLHSDLQMKSVNFSTIVHVLSKREINHMPTAASIRFDVATISCGYKHSYYDDAYFLSVPLKIPDDRSAIAALSRHILRALAVLRQSTGTSVSSQLFCLSSCLALERDLADPALKQ